MWNPTEKEKKKKNKVVDSRSERGFFGGFLKVCFQVCVQRSVFVLPENSVAASGCSGDT